MSINALTLKEVIPSIVSLLGEPPSYDNSELAPRK